ncbi:MAG: hypothetical protein J8272_00920 ['Prunus persica' phytoplasma PP2]|nr:hypothetical protein ['Prunus persica' phytoplasma PP2]
MKYFLIIYIYIYIYKRMSCIIFFLESQFMHNLVHAFSAYTGMRECT